MDKSGKLKPAIIIVDSLNLLNGDNSQSEYDINTKNIKKLKNLSKKLNCSVIVLSQLVLNNRLDRRPNLSDLKKVGDLESIADQIILLYQGDEYDTYSRKIDIVELIVAKNRNGLRGTVELVHFKNYGLFVAIDRNETKDIKTVT